MSKKGFSLIELLAVIVILGVVLSIATVSVNSIRKKQDEENRRNTISSILTGAKRYVSDNNSILDGVNSSSQVEIKVSDLLKGNYADFDTSKYDFENKTVEISMCGDESNLKLKYSLEGFNDCGCEEQDLSESNKICEN